MNEMRSCMNNTKSKKRVTVAHSKNNKIVHQQTKDQLAQSRALMPSKPKKALQMAMKRANEGLKGLSIDQPQAPIHMADEDTTDRTIVPRAKRPHNSTTDQNNQSSGELRLVIDNDILLPCLLHGSFMHTYLESINVINFLCQKNLRHPVWLL